MGQRGDVIVGHIVRLFFQGIQNRFKAGVVAANNSNAPEILEESGKQGRGFRLGFLLQSFERAAA